MSPRRKNSLPHDSVKRKAATNEVKQTESDIADALVELYQLLNKYAPFGTRGNTNEKLRRYCED